MALLRSPLHDRHVALGAKLAEFGGWEMPLEYSTGVLKEHAAVRERVGIFDVSHLGKIDVRGPGAAAYVNSTLSNDLGRIQPGQAQYTLCCDDRTGGVVDDLIVYLHDEDHLLLVPNAANTAEVLRRLRASCPDEVILTDQHRSHAVLAVQGPWADEVLVAADLPVGHPYMSFEHVTGPAGQGAEAADVTVCRTGYTGERGYELIAPVEVAGALWDRLCKAGDPLGMVPCGLGARDTLRTEMGYPLHGQDISLDVTPVQARLGWAVGWGKDAFWGKERLVAEKECGPDVVLRGLLATGRGIARPDMQVHGGESGESEVGRVTSGTFSPTLRTGIALALLDSSIAEGDAVSVDVRGRRQEFAVTRPPFVTTSLR